jgi:hypothetical protein
MLVNCISNISEMLVTANHKYILHASLKDPHRKDTVVKA